MESLVALFLSRPMAASSCLSACSSFPDLTTPQSSKRWDRHPRGLPTIRRNQSDRQKVELAYCFQCPIVRAKVDAFVYFNQRAERTLRTFSNPVNLGRFDRHNWMTTDQPLWFIAEYLFTIRHFRLLQPKMARRLHRLDHRSFKAGCLGRAEK